MADVQIAVIDPEDTQLALAAPAEAVVNVAVPGVQGPIGLTGSVAIAQDGTATEPGIRFESDTNTGIYRPGADQLAISTNGTGRLTVGTTAVSSTLAVDHPLGAVGTPSITFTGDLNTGFWSPSADAIAASTGGSERLRIDSSGRLGLGTSLPSFTAHISGTKNTSQLFIDAPTISAANDYAQIGFGIGGTAFGLVRLAFDNPSGVSNSYLSFYNNNGSSNVERMRIDSSGLVGIGTTSPTTKLHVQESGICYLNVNGQSTNFYVFSSSAEVGLFTDAAVPIIFANSSTEKARIDSSGRLLVGASSAYTVQGFNRHSYFCPTAGDTSNQIVVSSVSTGFPGLFFTRTRGATPTTFTTVQDNDVLGAVEFFGADGTDYSASGARIECRVDGTPGDNDMPGRLVFLVTADGASSPTEALRISSTRVISVADAGNIAFGTTTGTKIGTGTTQKIGFYNATPVVQPTAVADATDAASVITQLNALLTRMRNLGLIAT